MKIGDTFKMGYINDGHEHNYNTGIIAWVHDFKYYPNGKINEFLIRKQIKVRFDDNSEIMLSV